MLTRFDQFWNQSRPLIRLEDFQPSDCFFSFCSSFLLPQPVHAVFQAAGGGWAASPWMDAGGGESGGGPPAVVAGSTATGGGGAGAVRWRRDGPLMGDPSKAVRGLAGGGCGGAGAVGAVAGGRGVAGEGPRAGNGPPEEAAVPWVLDVLPAGREGFAGVVGGRRPVAGGGAASPEVRQAAAGLAGGAVAGHGEEGVKRDCVPISVHAKIRAAPEFVLILFS